MILDGEKWACESCVRGHRVSNCQHADRPLQHINKKGRPVSQCSHCRNMRRSKSAHVKCDCGEKTSKCVHLQATVDGHRESCCCNHGGRCTCSHKKEQNQLDTVPESDSEQELSSSTNAKASKLVRNRRSRASTQTSDGMLTFDENGHHKPTYKHTKASQKSGPYQLTRAHSAQSSGSGANCSMEDLANESSASSSGGVPQAQDHCMSNSETASPLLTAVSSVPHSNTQLPPLDLSNVNGWASGSFMPDNYDFFSNMDEHQQPMFSAGLSQPDVDWSHIGLDFASKDLGTFAPSSYSQAQSFAGFEQPPTLTSGEVSEVDDFIRDEFDPIGTFSRTNTSSTGFSLGTDQEGLLGAMEMGSTDFDDFSKLAKDGPKFAAPATALVSEDPSLGAMAVSGVAGFENDPIFWMNDADYSGMTAVNEVPDVNVNGPNFWEVQ
ncbi:hypothetical protein F5883DRAFT_247585 [Diaporthe sp. PMI_573]|nr:hypothetical protein F5883DRAFT_247585 [Diaporthaceae sp. PMI_573]